MLGEAVLLPAPAPVPDGALPAGPAGVGEPTASVNGEARLVLRPEQIQPDSASTITAVVKALDFRGHDAIVGLDQGHLVVQARWSSIRVRPVGETVGITVVQFGVLMPAAGGDADR
ncbi:MAG: TOBE domain-containing protein [Acidimicrobiales bacterium]